MDSMENFKGTKGEWVYQVNKGKIQVIIPHEYVQCGTILTLGVLSEDDCPSAECCKSREHANAKLIAASKDLLEALVQLTKEVELMCSIGSDPLFMEMLNKRNKAINAINKATL